MNSSRSSTVSERCFDYSASVDCNISSSTNNVPSSTVSAYLRNMQRGSLIQPFGCLIVVDEKNFTVLAYSVNALEMLDLAPHAVPNIEQQQALTFGADVQTLFRSSGAAALQKAAHFGEVNLLNPILVHSRTSSKPFYAILHRLDVGLVIDLEPVSPSDVPVTAAGALKSYKLAAKAISKLQSLPSGDISLFCDVIVKEVGDLTGYYRIMVYKFHEGEHGEVIAECHRPDLEPYLGLHFPATDIPKASQFLFMRNKISKEVELAGLTTDSLMEASYLGASALGDEVCGMAAIKITSKFLFWFRSHTTKEIKWGGLTHDPDDKDDGRKMHPRSSLKAFLEVV
ncbi:hypothetical protein DVH24_028026 [Malus domestica]|uniref:Phytochrome chromophore attachment site domain-containing protein n=1 Tax=Malus domestica TaxID=3750 RepID=A0A498HA45_MALDO|nr:hypothetical protein DVH24_028026 [Malus domestica]